MTVFTVFMVVCIIVIIILISAFSDDMAVGAFFFCVLLVFISGALFYNVAIKDHDIHLQTGGEYLYELVEHPDGTKTWEVKK